MKHRMKAGSIAVLVLVTLSIVVASCSFDALQRESASIRRDIETRGFATPEEVERFAEIDDEIQGSKDFFDLTDGVIGAVAGGTPIGLLWLIGSGIWKRRFATLVENVNAAGGVDTNVLGAMNAASGLQPHVTKPLAAAKAKALLTANATG